MEEEDACLVSKQNRSRLPSLGNLLMNELLLTTRSLFLPCPPPFLSCTSSRESSLCYHSGCWWTLTPSSSLMLPHGPCSSPEMDENIPRPSCQQDEDPELSCACVWTCFRVLQHRNGLDICSHWNYIRGFKALRGKNGFNRRSLISRLSLHPMHPTLSNTLATMMWEAEEALVTPQGFISGSCFFSLNFFRTLKNCIIP